MPRWLVRLQEQRVRQKAKRQDAKGVTLPFGDRCCGHGLRPRAGKKCARPENPFPARM